MAIVVILFFNCFSFPFIKKKPPEINYEPEFKGDMVLIPAGEFWMGCDSKVGRCSEYDLEYKKVYLDEYYIDRYEVTVGEYMKCVYEGVCNDIRGLTAERGDTSQECNTHFQDRNTHPINCVNWPEAKKYCYWAGKILPTEAQWEKAARGTDGRINPWGNQEASCEYAVIYDSETYKEEGCGKFSTWPVGSKPLDRSPYGIMDMQGNVSEWVLDGSSYPYYKSPNTPPADPGFTDEPIYKGESWRSHPPIFIYERRPAWYGSRFDYRGFRCAKKSQRRVAHPQKVGG